MELEFRGSNGFSGIFNGLPPEGKTIKVKAIGATETTSGYKLVVFKDPRNLEEVLKFEISRFRLSASERAWVEKQISEENPKMSETPSEAQLRMSVRHAERVADRAHEDVVTSGVLGSSDENEQPTTGKMRRPKIAGKKGKPQKSGRRSEEVRA
jgi:hypothetical protein